MFRGTLDKIGAELEGLYQDTASESQSGFGSATSLSRTAGEISGSAQIDLGDTSFITEHKGIIEYAPQTHQREIERRNWGRSDLSIYGCWTSTPSSSR